MSSVVLTPTTASQTSSDWSNLSGAYGTNTGSPATSNITGTATTGTLTLSNWAANQVPVGATINGIGFGGDAWRAASGPIDCSDIELSINGKSSGNVDSSTVLSTTTGASLSYGSSSTFPGTMAGITDTDVNSGIGSITLKFVGGPGNSFSTVSVSNWGLTVYYTTAPNQVIPHAVVIPAAYPHWLRD